MNMRYLLLSSFFIGMSISGADNLDATFNNGLGYVATQYAQGFVINDLKIQSDGKIVVGGYTQAPNTQAIIARYNTDGSLDSGFGSGGIVTASVGSNISTTVLQSLAIQADGKIVVVGYSFDTSSATEILVARYTTAGVLDGTFGSGGVVSGTFGSGSSLNSVVIDASSNIVAVGAAVISSQPNGIIVRLTSAGVLDGTFGSGGVVMGLVGLRTVLNDVAITSTGNIVVAGVTSTSTGDHALIAQYTTAGALDATFGSGGIITAQVGTRTVLNAVALDASGNIIVGGFAQISSADQFILARYTAAGVLDGTFGTGGMVTSLVGTGSQIEDIVLQSDGKIVVGCFIRYEIDQATVARYTSAGALDTTFGSGGVVSLNLGKGSRFNALAVQSSDQRVVAGGYAIDPTTDQAFGLVARFNKNNSDFVTITSITTSSISTKIPTISGTSSAAGAQVQVFINGVSFATVATDGSGNWNAGQSTVLPIGSNTIQANLIVGGNTIVSDKIAFTVVDTFGEDSVFVYDTTTQAISSLVNITFNTNVQVGTWSHTAGSSSFTCNKAGMYRISYAGSIVSVLAGSFGASMRLTLNGTEIAGSQANETLNSLGLLASSNCFLKNEIITTLAAGNVIAVQALGTNAQLAPAGAGTVRQSASIVIVRLK